MFKKILGVIFLVIGLGIGYVGVQVIIAGHFDWSTISIFFIALLFALSGISLFTGESVKDVLTQLVTGIFLNFR